MRMPMTVRPGTRLRYSESAGVLRRRALYTTDALAPLAGSAASTTLSRTRAVPRPTPTGVSGAGWNGCACEKRRGDRTVHCRQDSEAGIHFGKLAFEGGRCCSPLDFFGAGQVDW